MSELDRLLGLAVVGACGMALLSFLGWQRQHRPISAAASRQYALLRDLTPMPLLCLDLRN